MARSGGHCPEGGRGGDGGAGPATDGGADADASAGATGRAPGTVPAPASAGQAPAGPARPSKAAPATARLIGNDLLSRAGATKEVRQFTFDTRDGDSDGTPLAYEVGDALGVLPRNCPDLVAEWLALTGLDPATTVELTGLGTVPLGEALHRHLDIARITPALLRLAAERTGDRVLKKLLRPDNKGELAQWTWSRQAVDVLAEYPVRAGAAEWAGLLPVSSPGCTPYRPARWPTPGCSG